MEQERFRDLAIEYLLGTLEGDELASFDAELTRRGASGREELDRLAETLGHVAMSAPPRDPPAALRARVMAEVEAERRRVLPLRRRAAPRLWIAATAVAASLALFLGRSNLGLRRALEESTAALDSATIQLARADSLRRAFDALEADYSLLAAPAGSVVRLVSTGADGTGRARAFVDPETGRALLLVFDLPVLPPDSVYQLWTIRDGTPAGAGTFTVTPDGRGRLTIEEGMPLVGADAVAVTIEPAPGGPAPTGPIVLATS